MGLKLIITVAADSLSPHGTGSLGGSVLNEKLDMITSNFLWLSIIVCHICWRMTWFKMVRRSSRNVGAPRASTFTLGCKIFYSKIRTIWWRYQVETLSTLRAICEGNSPVTGEFPSQRPVTRSFDFFYLRLNKRLSKQSWSWWFETPSHPLWRHSNEHNQSWWMCIRTWISYRSVFWMAIGSTEQ